jgi:hypothetical protein
LFSGSEIRTNALITTDPDSLGRLTVLSLGSTGAFWLLELVVMLLFTFIYASPLMNLAATVSVTCKGLPLLAVSTPG